MSRLRARLREESGQSLVELLVTIALGLVVLTATLGAFTAFNSTARRTDAVVDVEDQSRTQLDRLTRELRGAMPVVAGGRAVVVPAASAPAAATTSDELVFGRVSDTASGGTAIGLRRYCVGGGTLWREDLGGTTAAAGAACPSTPDAARVLRGTPLAGATGTVFSLDAARSTIGIRLDLAAQTGPGRTSRIPIRTAVRLRDTTGAAPTLTAGDVNQTCQGGGRSLLTVGAGTGTGADAVVATTISVGGTVVGGASATLATAVAGTTANVTVRTASGLVQVIQKALVACP